MLLKKLLKGRMAMKFGYTIIYVTDVLSSLTFFETAFGFSKKFIDPSGDYGELETGGTTLSFAAHTLGEANLPDGYVSVESSIKPLGIEIALITDSVEIAHQKAILAGALELKPPLKKPWGQTVSYVRCPDGTLIELCTPIS
jgi:lactoylglutathione lyase